MDPHYYQNKRDSESYRAKGLRWVRWGRFQKAAGYLESALQLNPNDCKSAVYLWFCLYKLDQPELSILRLERFAETHPDNVALMILLARAYNTVGHYRNAVEVLDPLLKVNGSSRRFHLHGQLGTAYAGLEESEKAVEAWLAALKIRPGDAETMQSILDVVAKRKNGVESPMASALRMPSEI
ncbi:MAG: hypothetical protein HQL52_00520 [Magnetococcales bacterium]|nr:hypothetical protein [Magnetococcales bacterium]